MVYTANQIQAALISSQRRWSFRHEIIAADGTIKGLADVVDAKIANNDLATKIKRTGSFKISKNANFDFWHDSLRSFAKLRMLDGGWQEWCMGTFFLTTQGAKRATAVGGDMYEAEAYDRLLVLDEDAILDRYVVTTGTPYVTAIKTILASAGFTKTAIVSSDIYLPAAKDWDPGTSKLSMINSLLSALDYRTLTMDPYGIPTSGPYQNPDTAPVVWTYAVDRSSVVMPGIDIEFDMYNIPNIWIASVSEPDRPALLSVKINSDPNSIFSTVSRGRNIVRVIELTDGDGDGVIESATQAILDAKVARVASVASQQYAVASFNTGLMPFHGSGDVALVNYGDGLFRFREHSWEMDLRAGGTMKHVFRRVVTL